MIQEGRFQQKGRRSQIKRNRKSSQEDLEKQDDDDPVNCPLIFKASLVTCLTGGILVFIIIFGAYVQAPLSIESTDLNSCADSSNLRRISKSNAYESVILGLSISSCIFSIGLTIFLIIHAYNYCRCFDDCYEHLPEQEESSVEEQVDVEAVENEIKNKIFAQISKDQSILRKQPKSKPILKEAKQINQKLQNTKNPRIQSFLKTKEQIKEVQQKYEAFNSQNCECNDFGECLGVLIGCLWCRTCFEAHHYHFYRNKNQQYIYWVLYLVKTLCFGAALAYVIRLYLSFQQLGDCLSINAKNYSSQLSLVMIIGIATAAVDVFGYVHLLVQGSLLDIVQDTLHQQPKSQHSDQQQESEHPEYEQSSEQVEKPKKNKKQSKKKLAQSKKKPLNQSSIELQEQDLRRKQKLFQSLSHSKKNSKVKQVQPRSQGRDTSSFFITLRTMGSKYMEDIEKEIQNQKPEKSKNQLVNKISKVQEASRQSSETEKYFKQPTKMVKEQPQQQQQFERKPRLQSKQQKQKQLYFKKTQSFEVPKQPRQIKNEIQKEEEVSKYQRPSLGNGLRFGAFNKQPARNQSENKVGNNRNDGKGSSPMERLSKFSTKF